MIDTNYRYAKVVYDALKTHGIARNRRLTIATLRRVLHTLQNDPTCDTGTNRESLPLLAKLIVTHTNITYLSEDDLLMLEDTYNYLMGEVG